LIRLLQAAVVLHNLLLWQYDLPKSWFSKEDIVAQDELVQLDEELYLSPSVMLQQRNVEVTCRDEVHNFLSTKLL
jgi:hypothetical protein